jgi:RecB family exonuclease
MATSSKPGAKTAVSKAIDKVSKPVTSWSFSRYMDYSTCPRKFKLKHIDKVAEPKGDAMQRGIDIHNMAEAYVKGTLAKLPKELTSFRDEFVKLRKMYKTKKLPMIVEDNWAFTIDWDETQWNNWTQCWVRIKLDCAHYEERNVMFVTDYKTGKMSDFKNAEYMMQLELYALAALLMSAVDDVIIKPRILYTDTGDTYPPTGREVTYTRKDLPALMKTWNGRVKPMMTATNFPPRANGTCRWCWYGQAKKAEGGPGTCQF